MSSCPPHQPSRTPHPSPHTPLCHPTSPTRHHAHPSRHPARSSVTPHPPPVITHTLPVIPHSMRDPEPSRFLPPLSTEAKKKHCVALPPPSCESRNPGGGTTTPTSQPQSNVVAVRSPHWIPGPFPSSRTPLRHPASPTRHPAHPSRHPALDAGSRTPQTRVTSQHRGKEGGTT
jgi:hypothetical protein